MPATPTLLEQAEEHLRNIDTQLAATAQERAAHTKRAAELSQREDELRRHRDTWAQAVEAERAKAKRRGKKTSG